MRALVGLVAMLVALSVVGSASAKKPAPPPATLDTPQTFSPPAQGTPVSTQVALQAASQPGADTETLPGMTPAQAIAPSDVYYPQVCFQHTVWYQWGTWPYEQRVNQNTTWCGRNSVLTYRSTTVTLGSSLCTHSSPYSYKTGGGVGLFLVKVRSGGAFGCGIPVVGGYNLDRWFDAVYTAVGDAYVYDHS